MKSIFYIPLALIVISLSSSVFSEESALQSQLQKLEGVTIVPLDTNAHFNEAFEIHLLQPLDHGSADSPQFTQRIYLSHVDPMRPVVFVTAGYQVSGNYTTELAEMLDANQIIAEHRYFGESAPDSLDWTYLTVRQAATDHHRITQLFKSIYPESWVSTGISKGGQTTIYHRYLYPEDVAASVAYVAPLNLEEEDSRIHTFLDAVGNQECREKLRRFQRLVLKNREDLLPRYRWYARGKGYTFPIGVARAFEYTALEYRFAFWQWGNSDCESIPVDTAAADSILSHLLDVVPLYFFSDQGMKIYAPFFYQAYSELGFYRYSTETLAHLLVDTDDPTNRVFVPQNADISFSPELNRRIDSWLKSEASEMIFVYGEYDTWSATAVEIGNNQNLLKIVHPEGDHSVRINDLSENDKLLINERLEEWLNVDLEE